MTQEVFAYLKAKIADYEASVMQTILNRELIKEDQLQELNNGLVYYHALVDVFNLTSNEMNEYYADSQSKTA